MSQVWGDMPDCKPRRSQRSLVPWSRRTLALKMVFRGLVNGKMLLYPDTIDIKEALCNLAIANVTLDFPWHLDTAHMRGLCSFLFGEQNLSCAPQGRSPSETLGHIKARQEALLIGWKSTFCTDILGNKAGM
eukprot:1160341-Pelagomonas_calceolata.AAC.7